jgi:CBS-domain-containing membrane protein
MKASDVMTRNVITVTPNTPILHAVRLMLQKNISGLPVVTTNGELVGMVTEGDFLRRSETGTQPRHPRWIEILLGPGKLAEEYVRSSGRRVREVMTPVVHTVTEDTQLEEVVRLMERHHIKRVPVMRGTRVVGIVTRANLLRALVKTALPSETLSAGDQQIRDRLLAELERQPWAPLSLIDIVVKDGVVTISGTVTDDRQREALRVAAENIPGVRGVHDDLVWVEPISGMVA